ncbi:MAG TPA: NmrA/HSCARG family protein [Gammaproteobacteria bacterium]|nr:NmrA/HSCARG family protein [Gammaproteobacteria bacterium]
MISIQMRVLTVGLLLMTGVLQAVEPETILVMGASGRQGNAVVDELLLRGYAVRGMTRKPQGKKAQRLADKGVTVVQGDYADKDSVLAAMTGVQKAFFYSGFSRDELQEGRNVIAAAKQSGIRHLIYSSGAAAAPEGGMKDVVKAQVELALRDSGVPFSVVRPVAFMENFKGQQKRTIDNGVIDSRAPDRYVYFITIPDIGFFVGEAFDNPDEWLGRAENIAADKMTMTELAQTFGLVLGKEIAYVRQPVEEFLQSLPPPLRPLFRWYDEVGYSADTERLRARYPNLTTLEKYLRTTGWENW